MAIGSGGNYALAAAVRWSIPTRTQTIVRRALDIAADICVYTNRNLTIETAAHQMGFYAFRPMRRQPIFRWCGAALRCRMSGNGGAIRFPSNPALVSGDLRSRR